MIQLLLVLVSIMSIVFGVACYLNTRRWAHLCQRSRVIIAYNRRVQLNATFLEFLDWITSLDKDSGGRTIYKVNKMSVSIVKGGKPDKTKTTTVTTTTPTQEKTTA